MCHNGAAHEAIHWNIVPGCVSCRFPGQRSGNGCFPSRVVPASPLDTDERQPYGKEV